MPAVRKIATSERMCGCPSLQCHRRKISMAESETDGLPTPIVMRSGCIDKQVAAVVEPPFHPSRLADRACDIPALTIAAHDALLSRIGRSTLRKPFSALTIGSFLPSVSVTDEVEVPGASVIVLRYVSTSAEADHTSPQTPGAIRTRRRMSSPPSGCMKSFSTEPYTGRKLLSPSVRPRTSGRHVPSMAPRSLGWTECVAPLSSSDAVGDAKSAQRKARCRMHRGWPGGRAADRPSA